MGKECTTGRVTIPTDVDVVPETLDLVKRWGADAIRDCDGTDYPEELKKVDAKVYATYYTTRKDNIWAKANPDEIQQMYIMTSFHTATKGELSIHLMDHLYPDMLKVNSHDDIQRWWEVIDRTTGKVVPVTEWSYSEETGDVTIKPAKAFHDYTVSFLAYIMWDPVHMYNAVTNDWQGVEKQITFDVRQPKTKEYSKKRLRKFLESHPYVDVVRFTTFFHQFTLIFDELAREKYVDWYGYSASVSPYILEQFEQERSRPFVALCVMGGVFSEGIDLKEERLIGAVIVGTGLPQVNTEQEILKRFFDGKGKNGFDFAYQYPGMNKVLQAAGRVIRTASDLGVIALLDERFLYSSSRSLFPREWDDYQVVNLNTVEAAVKDFWSGKETEDEHKGL